MPWHIGESDSCPAEKSYAVIKDDDGDIEGCHASEDEAKNQLSALEADEPDVASADIFGIRYSTFHFEMRTVDGPSPKIDGYAALYNSNSEEMGFFDRFVERISPGAFDGVLTNDVRGLVNHDPNFVLGRSKSGTLRLSADSKGLHTEITPPDTQWARDLMVSMKRGDIDQMSFGFTVAKDGEHVEQDGAVRIIDRVARLFDVSVVTFPAYPATSVSARVHIASQARKAPASQRGRSVLGQPRFTAVSLARLNRRLHMAQDFSLQHHLRTTEGKN